MYLVNSNLAKSNSLLTRTKLVSLDRNLPQSGKSGGCGYRRRSSRIWHPAVLVKTRVWVGCTVSRAQKNSTRRSWCSLFEEWCVIFYNHSAWRVIFLLDFRDWWISFETRSTDINQKQKFLTSFPGPFSCSGGQGWRSGESSRLPTMWPGFKSRGQCHMWVLSLLFGSLPCFERFSKKY